MNGFLEHVSVGDAGVWGVSGFAYFREGITANNLDGTSWSEINGKDS